MTLEAVIGVGLFGLGLTLGLWFRHGSGEAKRRVEELEIELLRARGRLDEHREQVAKHFEQTSDLFQELTRDYTALYAHLAEGARDLCPDRVPSIGYGFVGPLLGEPPDPGEAEPVEHQPAELRPDEIPGEPEPVEDPPAESAPDEIPDEDDASNRSSIPAEGV